MQNSRDGNIQRSIASHSDLSVNENWSPPPLDFWKINTDAAWKDNPPAMGMGLISRNYEGAIIEASSYIFDSVPDAPCVELKAILIGIRRALDLGWDKVIIESDCQMAINFLTKKSM